jgi:hypothetical protein
LAHVDRQGYAPLNSDFDSFYTRRLKRRIEDCFSRPVTNVPGRTITLLERTSKDYNDSFDFTGIKRRALNVSSYNYLGFAQARGGCADAVEESIKRYGVSACGSRLESGSLDLHTQAEALVARFVGQEDAIIMSMGFATNSTTIPALVGKGCLVISDEYNHASIRVGIRLSGAVVRTFRHNDMKDLEKLLRECISQGQPRTHRPWKKILLVVEGLYSMEGSMGNIPAIMELKKRYKVSNVCVFTGDFQLTRCSSFTSTSTKHIRLVQWAPKAVAFVTTFTSALEMWTSLWARLPNRLARLEATSQAKGCSLTNSGCAYTVLRIRNPSPRLS